MDQDATWYGGRPRPRPHCARWGTHLPPSRDPQFLAHVYSDQTAGWIKITLGTKVDLGQGHIVLYGDLAPPPRKRHSRPPIFSPCLLWPNGWIDQDATWYGGRPWPRPYCVRWGPSSSPRPMSIVAIRSPISATGTAELLLQSLQS